MKKLKSILSKIKLYGLWVTPTVLLVATAALSSLNQKITIQAIFIMLIFGIGFQALIWSDNIARKNRGQDVSKMDAINLFKTDEYTFDDGRERAKTPPVAEKMITPTPYGHFIFGHPIGSKDYVAKTAASEGHQLIVGGSGSGKTQALLCSLVSLRNGDNIDPAAHYMVVDPKGEITQKIVKPNDGTIIFAPSDRKTWGYNPFYNLNEDSTEQDVYATMKDICSALLPLGSGDMAFWQTLAQTITTGAMMYMWEYKKIRTLPGIISEIMCQQLTQLIREIADKARPGSKCHLLIASFVDMPSDTVGSISANMQALAPYYLDSDIVYALSCNKRQFSPEDLLSHSVHICIQLKDMDRWSSVILLLFQQTISYCLALPDASEDPNRKPIYIVFEEMVAVLDSLHASLPPIIVTGVRFLRSKHVYLCLIAQSLSGLLAVSGGNKDMIEDFESSVSFILLFDATSPDTIRMTSDFIGTYPEKHVSWSGSGSNKSQQISYSESPIMRASDLITLGASKRAILISRTSGFNMIDKAAIWRDPILKKHLNP
ncbi:MAG: type IV secretory system conjugative DNA transfer family protein [Parabacteroides sp.]|nr:type IV secretory system conjugative DNA transfer family protein [Parabacteroides sp.]